MPLALTLRSSSDTSGRSRYERPSDLEESFGAVWHFLDGRRGLVSR